MAVIPVTITASSDIGQISNQPFQVGGALYVLTWEFHASLHIFRSLDDGNTWAELDAAHAPTTSSLQPSWVWDGATTFWICSASGGSAKMQFTSFSTLTGLWGVTTVTTNAADDTQQTGLIYRADTTIVAVGGIQLTVPARGGTQFFVFNTTTLGSTSWALCCANATQTVIHYGLFQGDSTTIWMVFLVDDTDLTIQSLIGNSTLGSIVTVDTGVTATTNIASFSDGTTVVIAWQPTSGASTITVWTGPVSTMLLVSQVTPVLADGVSQWTIIRQAGSSILFVSGFTTTVQLSDSGGGFSAPVLLVNAAYTFMAAGPVSGSLGLTVDAQPPVIYLAPVAPPVGPTKRVLALGAYGQNLPSGIGSLCKFARRVKCGGHPVRTILTGKMYVYGNPK